MNFAKMWLLLSLFFIVLTESFSVLNVVTGILVAGIVQHLNNEHAPNLGSLNIKTFGLWLWFLITLIKEVIVSNLQVAQIVLSREMAIDPKIIAYESHLKNDFLLTVYANAITLTPGTMTVEINKNKMNIHCLNDGYAQGLEGSALEKILLKIEERTHG